MSFRTRLETGKGSSTKEGSVPPSTTTEQRGYKHPSICSCREYNFKECQYNLGYLGRIWSCDEPQNTLQSNLGEPALHRH
jgi:hypothetical protein